LQRRVPAQSAPHGVRCCRCGAWRHPRSGLRALRRRR
jgi:hypothetical protein